MSIALGAVIITLAVGANLWLFALARKSVERARREGRLHSGWKRREQDDQDR